eukprot:TRINITY_DN28893_c0_g1_i2.p1 TRINITY_DN28893_c0_g1~~TRINITY_DN28893_c0_g1_i2.p1  ORF type:complete len:192 (+),score=17.32 TRINITY_DN28893_c0_g1_i2:21-596(+)
MRSQEPPRDTCKGQPIMMPQESTHQVVCRSDQVISKASCAGGRCAWSCAKANPKSLRLARMKSMQVMQAEEIGCKNGTRPISVGCSEGQCNFKCSREHMYYVTCAEKQIIHQDECSGSSCTWSCWNIITCSSRPITMVGCLGINDSCAFECEETSTTIRCGEGDEPKQDNCTGHNCSFGCTDVDSSVWDRF